MVLIAWGPMLELGLDEVDAQHRRLVDLVNELDAAMREGKGEHAVGLVLDDLVPYTVYHFAYEERLMDDYRVSSAEAHKAEHRMLIDEVGTIRATYTSGSVSASDLMDLLKTWLTDHILKTDKAMAKELIAKGAKSAA